MYKYILLVTAKPLNFVERIYSIKVKTLPVDELYLKIVNINCTILLTFKSIIYKIATRWLEQRRNHKCAASIGYSVFTAPILTSEIRYLLYFPVEVQYLLKYLKKFKYVISFLDLFSGSIYHSFSFLISAKQKKNLDQICRPRFQPTQPTGRSTIG